MDGMANNEGSKITLNDLARMIAQGFAEVRDDIGGLDTKIDNSIGELRNEMNGRFAQTDKKIDSFGTSLNHKIDQLDVKVEQHHEETKTELISLRGVVSGVLHTATDHERRINILEA